MRRRTGPLERQQNRVRGAIGSQRSGHQQHGREKVLARAGIRKVLLKVREELPRRDRAEFFDWFEGLSAGLDPAFKRAANDDLGYSVLAGTKVAISSDLDWLAYRLKANANHLNAFRVRAERLSELFWHDKKDEAQAEVDAIESEFGQSLWSIQAKIALAQEFNGLEAQKFAFKAVDANYSGGLPAYLAFYYSIQNEERSTYEPFREDFAERLQSSKLNEDIRHYLNYKVLGQVPSGEAISAVLKVEQSQSIIDLYETVLDVLSKALLLEDPPIWQASAVELLEKLTAINDWRLSKLIMSYQGTCDFHQKSNNNVSLGSIRDDCFGVILRLLEEKEDNRRDKLLIMTVREKHALKQIRSVLDRSETFQDDRLRLLKFGRNFHFITGATTLATICEIATAAFPSSYRRFGYAALHSKALHPADLLHVLGTVNGSESPRFKAMFPSTDIALWSGAKEPGNVGETSVALVLFWNLRMLAKDADAAADGLRELVSLDLTARQRNLVQHALVTALEQIGEWRNVLPILSELLVEKPQIIATLPVSRVLNDRDWRALRKVDDKLALSTCLYALWKQTDESLVATHLRFAFEEVLLEISCDIPSKVPRELVSRKAISFFLKNVCIPVLMDTSGFFESSEELLAERVSILNLLLEARSPGYEDSLDERTALLADAAIKSGLRIVDSNRVSVDTGALTRWAVRRFGESFSRYQALRAAGIGTNARFEEIYAAVQAASDRDGEYFQIPENEADTLLLEIILGLRDQFLRNSNSGLEFFLGKRVRHGVIAGHMRGSAEVARIITERRTPNSPYVANDFWLEQLAFFDAVDREVTSAAFNLFSEAYDQLIAEVRDRYLHVKTASHPDGIFDVIITAPQFHVLSAIATPDTDFEHFVSICHQTFWALLNPSLEEAKTFLSDRTKNDALRIFGALQQSLVLHSVDDDARRSLASSIQSVSTDVQRELDAVAAWFNKNATNMSRSFTFQAALDIAIHATLTSMPNFQPTVNYGNIEAIDTTSTTMLVMWEFIYVVLDNVHRRAKVGNYPIIKLACSLDRQSQVLVLKTVNSIGSQLDRFSIETRLAEKREKILEGDFASEAGADRGSGLLKVASLVSQYKMGVLSFALDERLFITELRIPVFITDKRFSIALPDVE